MKETADSLERRAKQLRHDAIQMHGKIQQLKKEIDEKLK
jgi:hypothetical protein